MTNFKWFINQCYQSWCHYNIPCWFLLICNMFEHVFHCHSLLRNLYDIYDPLKYSTFFMSVTFSLIMITTSIKILLFIYLILFRNFFLLVPFRDYWILFSGLQKTISPLIFCTVKTPFSKKISKLLILQKKKKKKIIK